MKTKINTNPIPIYTYNDNRKFRLVKIENEQPNNFKGCYSVVIKWIDSGLLETFAYETIEKYLI